MDKPVLVIISGVSASGKSTLAHTLSDLTGFDVLSVDDFKECVFDKFGFMSKYERDTAVKAAIWLFKVSVFEKARRREPFIIEYQFAIFWQEYFDYIKIVYNYELVVINCTSRTLDEIWSSVVERYSTDSARSASLLASEYVKDKHFVRNNVTTEDRKNLIEKQIREGTYTSISGDRVLTDRDVYAMINKL